MPATNPLSPVGGTTMINVGVPGTNDLAGFNTLFGTNTALPGVLSWDSPGDQSDAITADLLSGRRGYTNDIAMGGELNFSLQYILSDPGQALILANNNGTANVSVRHTDPDGKTTSYFGVICNVKDMPRSKGQIKGYTGTIRVNSPTIRS